ncbi:MAG: hypothetical protein ACPGXY_01285 [Alphaproteobacteria bacterium]
MFVLICASFLMKSSQSLASKEEVFNTTAHVSSQHVKNDIKYNDNVSMAAQKNFITLGHEILERVYNEGLSLESIDTSGYFLQGIIPLFINDKLPTDETVINAFHNFEKDPYKSLGMIYGYMKKFHYSSLTKYAIISNAYAWMKSASSPKIVLRRVNYLMTLNCIMWALYDRAEKEQNAFFPRGAFILIDPDHKLHDYFFAYTQMVCGEQKVLETSYLKANNNFSYRRLPQYSETSHLPGLCKTGTGIDFRVREDCGVFTILPNSHSHILTAKLVYAETQKEQLFYIKGEQIGMGSKGAVICHAANFASKESGSKASSRRERVKDIPQVILQLMETLRHEYKIDGAVKSVQGLLRSITKQVEQSKDNLLFTENFGALVSLLEEYYPKQNHTIRHGNEVQLDMGKHIHKK